MVTSFIDFRCIGQSFQQAIFYSFLEGLKGGESLEFLIDQNPTVLKEQLNTMGVTNVEWAIFAEEPSLWKARITKIPVEKSAKEDGCCGLCGGHNPA